jgi:hypothetical protein
MLPNGILRWHRNATVVALHVLARRLVYLVAPDLTSANVQQIADLGMTGFAARH